MGCDTNDLRQLLGKSEKEPWDRAKHGPCTKRRIKLYFSDQLTAGGSRCTYTLQKKPRNAPRSVLEQLSLASSNP